MPSNPVANHLRVRALRSWWMTVMIAFTAAFLSACGGGGDAPARTAPSEELAVVDESGRTQIKLRRQDAKSAALSKAANQATAWAPATAYVVSDVVRLSGGQLIIASTGGTSDASEPGFSAIDAIADGTVIWQALNESTQAAEVGAPAVVVDDVAGVSSLPVQHNLLFDAARFSQPTAPNIEAAGGSGVNTRTRAWSVVDGSSNENGFGANGRSGKYRTIEFETAADVIEIGYFAITAGFPHERLRVWVNDRPVSEAPLVPGAAGGSRFFRLSITAPHGTRRIRIAAFGTMLLSYVAVGAGETIAPPAQRSLLMAFIADSFFDTESPSILSAHHDMGVRVAQRTGFPHCVSWSVGGTSYSMDSNGRAALQTLLTLNSLSAFGPDAVVVGHGSNAANLGVTPAIESAAARASWDAIRAQAARAPIIVIGTWYRHPNFVAQHDAMQAAFKAEFLAWRDPNAAFIDPHDGSIMRGDGSVVRSPGVAWLNSSNVSWAFPPTGGAFDGFHPSPPGVYSVLTPALVDSIDAALTALGY